MVVQQLKLHMLKFESILLKTCAGIPSIGTHSLVEGLDLLGQLLCLLDKCFHVDFVPGGFVPVRKRVHHSSHLWGTTYHEQGAKVQENRNPRPHTPSEQQDAAPGGHFHYPLHFSALRSKMQVTGQLVCAGNPYHVPQALEVQQLLTAASQHQVVTGVQLK